MPTRNLTILFTDIQGFTARTSSETRAGVANLLEEHERLLSPVFAHFHGNVVKTIGDAFLVTFESPTDAVVCGVAIQEVLRQHNAQVPDARKLAVRVAINVGEVEIRDGDVFGEPVNLAARLEGITEAGEVYFTEAVYLTMNRREAPSTSIGEHTFKGIPGTVRVYKVLQDAGSEQVKQIASSVEVGQGQVRFRGPEGAGPVSGAARIESPRRRLAGRILITFFVVGGIGLGLLMMPVISERMAATEAQKHLDKKDVDGALGLLEANLDRNPNRPNLVGTALDVARMKLAQLEKDQGAQAALDFVKQSIQAHPYLQPLDKERPRLETTATLRAMLRKGVHEYQFFDALNELVNDKYPHDPDVPYAAAEVLKDRFIVETQLSRYRIALDRGHSKTEAMYQAAIAVLSRNLPGTSEAQEGLAMLDKAFPDRKLAWAQKALVDGTGYALLNAWPVLEANHEPRLSQPLYLRYHTVMLGKDVGEAAAVLGGITDQKEALHAERVLEDALAEEMLPDASRPPLKKALDALSAKFPPPAEN